jgi:hypothetical protein
VTLHSVRVDGRFLTGDFFVTVLRVIRLQNVCMPATADVGAHGGFLSDFDAVRRRDVEGFGSALLQRGWAWERNQAHTYDADDEGDSLEVSVDDDELTAWLSRAIGSGIDKRFLASDFVVPVLRVTRLQNVCSDRCA